MNKRLTKGQIALAFITTLVILVLSITPLISVFFNPLKEIEERLGSVFSTTLENEINNATSQAEIDEINKKYNEVNKMIEVDSGSFKISLAPVDFVLGAIDTIKLVRYIALVTEYDELVEKIDKPDYDTKNEETDVERLTELKKQIEMFDGSAITVESVSVLLILFNGVINLVGDVARSGQTIGGMMIMLVQFALLISVYIGIPLRAIFTTLKMLKALFTRCDNYGDKYSLVLYHFFSILKCFVMLIAAKAILSVSFTLNGWIMILVVSAVFLINFITSRMKQYSDAERRYLNLEQITAFVAVIGTVMFVVGILKSNIVGHLTGPDITAALLKKYGDIESKGFVYSGLGFGVLAMIMQIACISTIKAAVSYMTYASCMLDREDESKRGKRSKKKKNSGNNGIGPVVMNIILMVISLAVMVANGVLLTNGIGAFLMAILGLIIVVIARRIAYKKSIYEFQSLTYEQKRYILCGLPMLEENLGKSGAAVGNSPKQKPNIYVRNEKEASQPPANRATIVEARSKKSRKPNIYVKKIRTESNSVKR